MTAKDTGPLAALHNTELFTGLLPDELAQIQAITRRHQLQAGERIFRLGEPAHSIFIVESGSVGLTLPLTIRGTSQDVTIDEKGHGAVVAWSALVPPHRFTLGAHALTPTSLVGIQRDELAAVFERCPRIKLVVMSNLAQVIASRLFQLEGILLRDLQRWVSEKCA